TCRTSRHRNRRGCRSSDSVRASNLPFRRFLRSVLRAAGQAFLSFSASSLNVPIAMVTPERLLARNDGKQKVGGAASSRVEHVGPGVVVRAVMGVRDAAYAIARLYVEPDAVAFFERHRGRPDLDFHLHRFARLQPLALEVRVIGAPGSRQ